MTFAPQRELRTERKGLLELGFEFGFESWSAARPGGLLAGLPMGAQDLLGAILDRGSNPARTKVPPVVIGEIPRTISPQDTGRGAIPQKVNFPSELEELLEERRRLEEIISQSPVGTGTLPPIDEEKWGEIIRIPSSQVPESSVDDSEFEEDEPMAHTWFHSATELASSIWGQPAGGGGAGGGARTPAQTDAWLQNLPPTYGTDNGRIRCKRRRRQRNILTQSNLNMLFQIATLPNNANVRVALSRAIK